MLETPFREIEWTVGDVSKIQDDTLHRIYGLKGITIHEQVWLRARCAIADPTSVVYQILEYQGKFYFDVFWTNYDHASGRARLGMIAETWVMAKNAFTSVGIQIPVDVWPHLYDEVPLAA